jgi:hypothetical protein
LIASIVRQIGKLLLYLPEEYIIDQESYYKEYFNKKYDYIFEHGVIIEGMPMVALSQLWTIYISWQFVFCQRYAALTELEIIVTCKVEKEPKWYK